jgi:hypothetical protein
MLLLTAELPMLALILTLNLHPMTVKQQQATLHSNISREGGGSSAAGKWAPGQAASSANGMQDPPIHTRSPSHPSAPALCGACWQG